MSAERKEKKLVRNEALFRQVNERLRDVGESFSVVSRHADFVCECSDETCAEAIELSLDEYERVRSDPRLFVVVRGHERPEVDTVAYDLGEGLLVVRKPDDLLSEIAVVEDPRR